jgi:hypothetical protein
MTADAADLQPALQEANEARGHLYLALLRVLEPPRPSRQRCCSDLIARPGIVVASTQSDLPIDGAFRRGTVSYLNLTRRKQMTKTRLSSKGQVIIPKEVRDRPSWNHDPLSTDRSAGCSS